MPRSSHALGVALCLLVPQVAAAVTLGTGDVLVADGCSQAAAARVLVIRPSGDQEIVTEGDLLERPVGIAYQDGEILVSDSASGAGGAVIRVDPTTGDQSVVSGSFASLWDLAVEPGGDLAVTDLLANAVIRVDPVSGSTTPISSGGTFQFLQGIAVAPSGDIYLTDAAAPQRLLRVAAGSAAQSTITGGLVLPLGLVVAADGDVIVADGGAGAVIRVDPSSGDKTTLASGTHLRFPADVARASGGYMVADWGDFQAVPASIVRVGNDGSQTPLSAGGLLAEPCGVVVVPEPFGSASSLAACAGLAAILRRTRSRS